MNTRVFFLVTVDGDLRVGTPIQQEASVTAMREVHRELGLLGRTTWMLNECDFHWTTGHKASLLDLLATGECLGVHDHLDTHHAETYGAALDLMTVSRRKLVEFCGPHSRGAAFLCHRDGCCIQSTPVYRALLDLGYAILSDVQPGLCWSARMVVDQGGRWQALGVADPDAIHMDNARVPLGAVPWRHDAENWLDPTSREGPFLQVPVICLPWIDRERLTEAIRKSGPMAFPALDTHPYDLQDPLTGNVSAERVQRYRESLVWVQDEFRAVFIKLDEVPDYWSEERS